MHCYQLSRFIDNIIAFDKPYQMAYSGAPSDQAQFDRIIQEVKMRVAPVCDRLYLLRAIDKDITGILLFAKYCIDYHI